MSVVLCEIERVRSHTRRCVGTCVIKTVKVRVFDYDMIMIVVKCICIQAV